MSWATVRVALKARFESAMPAGTMVHTYERVTREPIESDGWKAIFGSSPGLLRFISFRRTARKIEHVPAHDNRRRLTHMVQVTFVRNWKDSTATELLFQDELDALCLSLEAGDRTLGGVCQSYSLPDFPDIGHDEVSGALVHAAMGSFWIEEIVAVTYP